MSFLKLQVITMKELLNWDSAYLQDVCDFLVGRCEQIACKGKITPFPFFETAPTPHKAPKPQHRFPGGPCKIYVRASEVWLRQTPGSAVICYISLSSAEICTRGVHMLQHKLIIHSSLNFSQCVCINTQQMVVITKTFTHTHTPVQAHRHIG